ncbi:DUF6517 family protein [Natronobiforma cellulositropha]|uniref:DUF6517 family protein n=1 Tax=Natronobiforma cellulositropha TaxID=1679076 RepID=UPI0021D5A9A8|nr:DUF6517 family protein [Natronobiforma cellulositropha]
MYSRRAILAGSVTGIVALSAGCLDLVRGNPVEFEAAAVRPTDDALAETGYEEGEADWERIEETVEAAGVEREIHASIWAAIYGKEVAIAGVEREAAVFAAVSLPSMEILGRTMNPLEDMNNREVLEEVRGEIEGNYGGLRNVSHRETFGLEILDAERTVEAYDATTDVDGQEVEIVLLLSTFDHDDDILVLLGGYPRLLPDEGVDLETLLESVEHPLEE